MGVWWLGVVMALILAGVACDQSPELLVEPLSSVDAIDNGLANTDLILAFVMFRHGDRTPDEEELSLFPMEEDSRKIFFPYGKKALTNKGKQRGYRIGEYLRKRYDGLVSRLYIPDEVMVRTTDYMRTKMMALTALAALYPPTPAQRWNPTLDWQPIPYDTLPYDDDDLLYWYNCPRYLSLRNRVYELPEVIKKWIKPYQGLFNLLKEKTGNNITKPEDVFFLDNLFQTLENVGIRPPLWAQEVMPKIQEMTKIEFAIEVYNSELIRLATGVLMNEIINATSYAVLGGDDHPKLRLYSAHENNVAALMAAARVFQPHQPSYGSTLSIELRRRRLTGQYGITVVYSAEAGGPGKILPISGCGGEPLCDYETFLILIQDSLMTIEEYRNQCPRLAH